MAEPPNSWDDEEQNLSQQTQQNLNLNPKTSNFQPKAASFTPGASSYQPQYPAYGYNQQQYGGYSNYGQIYGGQQQGYPQYGYGGGYQQPYGAPQGYQNQQQQFGSAQGQQQQPPVTIAKRPTAGGSANGAADAKGSAPKAKVLSLGADTAAAPKVEKAGNTKVLSIGSTAPAPAPSASTSQAKKEAEKAQDMPSSGSKVTAKVALEKSTKASTDPSSGKTSPTPSSGRNSPSRAEKSTAATRVDAVEKEQAEAVDEETLREMYGKEHVNVIFLGHVDAGKSTLGGSILLATGQVDDRTMEKYKREAKEAGRESWWLSWALDLTKEERAKGKTVEVGRGEYSRFFGLCMFLMEGEMS